MHKQLSVEELARIEADHPVRKLTKAEKLNMWADLVARQKKYLGLYHRLEYWPPEALDNPLVMAPYGHTAITIALAHDAFKAEGIGESIGSAVKFFELSKDELHEFSCDCGGAIDNKEQASRIRNIAGGSRTTRSAHTLSVSAALKTTSFEL